jgi:anti-sigma28 factor (negative regulator of flagellin synthesis)
MCTEARVGLEELMMLPGVSHMLGALPESAAPESIAQVGRSIPDGATSKLNGGDAVRIDKVMAIRSALEKGDYEVSPRAVAAKMVDAMLTLGREWPYRERRKRPRLGHRGLLRGSRGSGRFGTAGPA